LDFLHQTLLANRCQTLTLIPVLERLFIRDLIHRGEREGRKIEAVREKVQFKTEKKSHAR
jgi:hypothetical protein